MWINPDVLPAFLAAVAVLMLVPGPDFFLITSQAATRGARYGAACALGIGAAGLLQTTLVAAGLGHLMETWPSIATAVRWAGAAYLGWMGLSLLRRWWRERRLPVEAVAGRPEVRSVTQIFMAGLLNNLLNPKALLFFSVFIPQFVDPAFAAAPLQLATLGLLLTLLALLFNLAVALLFAQLKQLRLGRGALSRHGNGLIGALFVLIAGRLALARAS
ncbi:LysE family translocator [Paucibacter sp. APW11]|uniref:LysE family translocator n=1 Tax=Roseateles aquae TaxID=3077235 RepID=A0ABU3PEW2_9BURK|nr:LysE family translocator [Paucibacter sp. APW11]MDT9000837.1 LysE family translocator [Paucibacter sp. APW11]